MLLERIEAALHPVQVWFFGSRARGDEQPWSDWDLFVVVPDDTPDALLDLVAVWRLTKGAGVPSDVIVCRQSDFQNACDTVNTLSYEVANKGGCSSMVADLVIANMLRIAREDLDGASALERAVLASLADVLGDVNQA